MLAAFHIYTPFIRIIHIIAFSASLDTVTISICHRLPITSSSQLKPSWTLYPSCIWLRACSLFWGLMAFTIIARVDDMTSFIVSFDYFRLLLVTSACVNTLILNCVQTVLFSYNFIIGNLMLTNFEFPGIWKNRLQIILSSYISSSFKILFRIWL